MRLAYVFLSKSTTFSIFEHEPLQRLAEEGELMSYMHEGFWQCMDTKHEQDLLEQLLNENRAPWKKWEG